MSQLETHDQTFRKILALSDVADKILAAIQNPQVENQQKLLDIAAPVIHKVNDAIQIVTDNFIEQNISATADKQRSHNVDMAIKGIYDALLVMRDKGHEYAQSLQPDPISSSLPLPAPDNEYVKPEGGKRTPSALNGDNKITITEPYGPLRTGLWVIGDALTPEKGCYVFWGALDLANTGLELVLDLENLHGLGNSDISIPPPLHTIGEARKRGAFTIAELAQETVIARL